MNRDIGTTPRKVSPRDKLRIWERDKGVCQGCQRVLRPGDEWICEHLRALELGGSNDDANLAVYCVPCAREKTSIDHSRAAKAKRQKQAALGIKAEPAKPLRSAPFTPAPKQAKASKPIDKLAALPRRSMFQ